MRYPIDLFQQALEKNGFQLNTLKTQSKSCKLRVR